MLYIVMHYHAVFYLGVFQMEKGLHLAYFRHNRMHSNCFLRRGINKNTRGMGICQRRTGLAVSHLSMRQFWLK